MADGRPHACAAEAWRATTSMPYTLYPSLRRRGLAGDYEHAARHRRSAVCASQPGGAAPCAQLAHRAGVAA